jgi:hypothetical protein
MWKVSVVTALVILAAPSARAANPDLQRALKLYDDLDYMPALDALQSADARPNSTHKEKVEIQIYIGMISIALGDETKARKAFAKAIALDRKAMAPAGASPKVASILDQLRNEAPAESPPPEQASAPQPPVTAPPPEQPQQGQPQQAQQPAANPYSNQYPPSTYPQQNAYPNGSPYYAQPQPQQTPPPQQPAPYAAGPDQPTASTTAPVESGSSNTWSAVTGFTALILGAAGIGAGVYFQLQANSDVTTGNSEVTAAAALNDQNSANQAWTYTLVGYVAGGVLFVGGLTLVIVHYATGSSHPSEPHAGEVSVTPRGLALSF